MCVVQPLDKDVRETIMAPSTDDGRCREHAEILQHTHTAYRETQRDNRAGRSFYGS